MTQWNLGVDLLYDKERIFAALTANHTFVHMFKPEYIEAIMNSNTIIDKAQLYSLFKPFIGDGLLLSAGDKWRTRRKLLTPAFHFKILERFIPIFNYSSYILIRKLKSKCSDSFLDIVPFVSLCTLDIIGETAMGVKINSQENEKSEYVKAVIKLEELLIERSLFPWYWIDSIYYLLPIGKEFKRTLNIVHNFTRQSNARHSGKFCTATLTAALENQNFWRGSDVAREKEDGEGESHHHDNLHAGMDYAVISEKKYEMKQQLEEDKNFLTETDTENIYLKSKHRMAFLELLLHRHFMDGSISEEDIREEVDTFMFEGHDTTAMGISWALYNLGIHLDIQEKAYQEILDIFGEDKERPVTVDDIRKMKYLECVIKEALRLHPPVPFIGRNTPEDININGKKIPAGSIFNVSILGVHRDPEIYSNPDVFDPERFFPENSLRRHPFAYIPFSAGPRNCIGQKFAMMEEKTVISNILRHFHVESQHPRDKIVSCAEMVLRPINGLHLKFTERR